MRKICVYDIEVMMNVFICCCKVAGQDPITFEISTRKNELQELVRFFKSDKYVFVGYNNEGYDGPIMNMIIHNYLPFYYGKSYFAITDAAYSLSSEIINRDRNDKTPKSKYFYMEYFPQIDLMTMMASQALRVGLKSLQVTMCYHNVKEMVIDWNKPLPTEMIDSVIMYCHNDIGSTSNLASLLKSDLKLRIAIEKEFKIKCLSKDGVGIGVEIFTDRVKTALGIYGDRQLFQYRQNIEQVKVADYIPDIIKFKTPACQAVLKHFKEMVLRADCKHRVGWVKKGDDEKGDDDDTSFTARVNNLEHKFGVGGIHSINTPIIYTECSKYIYRDADVASLYPRCAIIYRYGPAGFKEVFLDVLEALRVDRIVAKKAKDKLKDTTYKLALNSILGHLRNEYGPYYAPEANIGICVTGQLLLLMLIEELELNGIEVVSSNTDGVTVKLAREKEELYNKICNDWQALTQFELEFVDYEKMVIVAVNDYVAFKKGYWFTNKKGEQEYAPGYSDIKDSIEFDSPEKAVEFNFTYPNLNDDSPTIIKNSVIKEKGMFITNPRLGKGLESLIIPKALIHYFGKGTPIRDTVTGSKSIWDFIIFKKIGKQYKVVWNEEEQQHINRYYVSKRGAYLYKRKQVVKYDKKACRDITVFSDQNVLKGSGVALFNTLEEKSMKDYDIDYDYYVRQCNKVIRAVEPTNQQSLF